MRQYRESFAPTRDSKRRDARRVLLPRSRRSNNLHTHTHLEFLAVGGRSKRPRPSTNETPHGRARRRRNESSGPAPAIEVKRMTPFIDTPAAVVAALDQVGEFPQILPVVSDPQSAGFFVNRHPPRIAMTKRPNLAARSFNSEERVVGRNTVRFSRRRMIHVNAKNLAEQRADVLGSDIVIRIGRAVAQLRHTACHRGRTQQRLRRARPKATPKGLPRWPDRTPGRPLFRHRASP